MYNVIYFQGIPQFIYFIIIRLTKFRIPHIYISFQLIGIILFHEVFERKDGNSIGVPEKIKLKFCQFFLLWNMMGIKIKAGRKSYITLLRDVQSLYTYNHKNKLH